MVVAYESVWTLEVLTDVGQVYVCRCLRVTENDVRQVIAETGATTVREITCQTGAGAGCTACHRRIRALLAGS